MRAQNELFSDLKRVLHKHWPHIKSVRTFCELTVMTGDITNKKACYCLNHCVYLSG